MKRQLTEEEKELTTKSIERIQEEKRDLSLNLDFNKGLIDKQRYLRAFDERWRIFLQEQKYKEDNEILKKMQQLLDQKTELLKELDKQIREGVEKPSTVQWNKEE